MQHYQVNLDSSAHESSRRVLSRRLLDLLVLTTSYSWTESGAYSDRLAFLRLATVYRGLVIPALFPCLNRFLQIKSLFSCQSVDDRRADMNRQSCNRGTCIPRRHACLLLLLRHAFVETEDYQKGLLCIDRNPDHTLDVSNKYLPFNQGDTIRTCGLLVPNQTLYQAELRPV